MSPENPNRVSVIDPITPAIERVKEMLFRPFDLRRWFVIGFCAWLAYLGGNGGGGGGGSHWNRLNKPHEHKAQIEENINAAKEYVSENMFWIVPAVVIGAIIIIGIILLVTWLNSRGRFMFLHCVAENKSEVKIPWYKFRKHANSLFLFRLVLYIISFFIVAVPILGIIFFIIMMVTENIPGVASIPGIIIFGLILFALAISLFLIKKFTFDFVVPIMFLRTTSCVAGWREFMAILSSNKGRLTLYILFQIVISIAIGAIVFVVICIGCCICCVGLLLFIPYIGTVILLPLFVFKRSYSLYYLRQFGPGFDVFSIQAELAENTDL
jgi:MFS family permease